MTDLLLLIGFNNFCLSLAIALVAWTVHATGKNPRVAYLLWLLVLAKQALQDLATQLSEALGLRSRPRIVTTAAQRSPMVWWAGGRPRVVLPEGLLQQASLDQLRPILAHELAHLKRRNHLTRWLEWLACACFWWNPVAWLARSRLRINEELCCDALVLDSLRPRPNQYAKSLLAAVDYLSSAITPLPATASGINSGSNSKGDSR